MNVSESIQLGFVNSLYVVLEDDMKSEWKICECYTAYNSVCQEILIELLNLRTYTYIPIKSYILLIVTCLLYIINIHIIAIPQ